MAGTSTVSPARVARRTAMVTVGSVGVQLLTVAGYIVLARLAPPELFGAFAAASILVTFGTLFVESGMTAALVHRAEGLEEAAATALVATVLAGVLLAGVSAALAPLVGAFFEGDDIGTVALAVSGMHVINGTTVVPDALLQRRMSIARATLVEAASVGSYATIAAMGLLTDLGIWSFVIAIYGAGVVRASFIWVLARWRPNLRLASVRMWRELASYGRHVLAGEIVRNVGSVLNTVTIGRFLGVVDLAQFNYGNRLATQSARPLAAGIGAIVFPALAGVARDHDVFARGFARALRAVAFIALPLSLVFLAVGEPLAVLLFGEQWRPAGGVLASMCLVPASVALISLALETFKAAGRPQMLPRIHLPTALVPVAALAFGVPFGLVMIGSVMSIGLAVVALRAIVLAARTARAEPRIVAGALAVPAAITTALAVCLLLADRQLIDAQAVGGTGWIALVAEVIAFFSIYLVAMRLLAPSTTREVRRTVGQMRYRRRVDPA